MPAGTFKVKYGLDVNGDISVTGLVDSVDIAAFKTDYDNHTHPFSDITSKFLADMDEKNYSSLDGLPTSLSDINSTEGSKLAGIEDGADVTDATNVADAGAVMKTDYSSDNSILVANTANSVSALSISASTLIGRSSTGGIASLSATTVRSILNVEDGADVTDSTNVDAAGAVMETDFSAGTFLYADTANTPVPKTAAEVRVILNVEDGANNYVHPNHTGEVTSTGDGATVISDGVVDADNLKGASGALGTGTSGQALIAGTTSGTFAWHSYGTAADKNYITSVDTSSDLVTSNGIKTYVDNQIAGLGRLLPGVQDLTALKNEADHQDKDMILVEDLGLYRFDAESSDTADDNLVVAPSAGISGRWIKMSSTINEHANLDGIDKWGGVSSNTYHVPNINNNSATYLDGTGNWSTPPGTYVHPDHTGDVTSNGDGATTISTGAVTNSKLANMAQNTIKGRITTGTGAPEDLTAAQVRSILNVEDGANNYVHPSDGGGNQTTLTGAQVYSDIEINTLGHVTSTSIRTMTLSDLGYTGDTNANYYVHPDHSGDVSSFGDGATTINTNVIDPTKLKGPSGSALTNGSNGDVLQSAGDGTFKWGVPASSTNVDYDYGYSDSFSYTGLGTTLTTINTFDKTLYRSVDWFITVYDVVNSVYETLTISAVHDGTSVYYNEYGNIDTGTSAGVSFSVIVNGNNIELQAQGTSTNNEIKGIRHLLDV